MDLIPGESKGLNDVLGYLCLNQNTHQIAWKPRLLGPPQSFNSVGLDWGDVHPQVMLVGPALQNPCCRSRIPLGIDRNYSTLDQQDAAII